MNMSEESPPKIEPINNSEEEFTGGILQIYKSITLDILKVFEFFLICLIIIVAILSIYNISARETLSKTIDTQILELNSQFVSANKIVLDGNLTPQHQNDVANQIKKLEVLEQMSLEVKALKAYGADNESPNLLAIKSRLIGRLNINQNSAEQPYSTSTAAVQFLESALSPFGTLSSDVLLALALLSCGALGAVIASIRSNNNVDLSKFTIGFTTGFITYLGIKGGQFVFLLQTPGAAAVLNPYTASFVGLISGMFSERFHQMLAHFLDKATEKFKTKESK